MDMNARIANELMKLAKTLAAGDWDGEEEENKPVARIRDIVLNAIGMIERGEHCTVNVERFGGSLAGKIVAYGFESVKADDDLGLSLHFEVKSHMRSGNPCMSVKTIFDVNNTTAYLDESHFMLHNDFSKKIGWMGEKGMWKVDAFEYDEKSFEAEMRNMLGKVVQKLKSIYMDIAKKVHERYLAYEDGDL